jgi:hypothetical protein
MIHVPIWFMEQQHTEPKPPATPLTTNSDPHQSTSLMGCRHDGWTGERMATFLEVLADTGIVSEACRAAGMSREAAYRLRGRDPVFGGGWRAAQAQARTVVADGLLERSITGTVEHYYRDGELVGERRHYESWLGLAVLKRLDKLAEEDRRAQSVRGTDEHDNAGNALAARMGDGWHQALDALREGGTAAVPAALEPEVDEVDTPPPPGLDPSENCWKSADGEWVTSFPPPPGFHGFENVPWDGIIWYERACTPEEAELLDADEAAADAKGQMDTGLAEAARDEFFARLRRELSPAQAVLRRSQ